MKKIVALVFALILTAAPLAACASFTPPPSKERKPGSNTDTDIVIFNNLHFNAINFSPKKLVLREDFSGYVIYAKENTTVSAEENNINITLDQINNNSLSEGDFQAGYRIVYIRENAITQRQDGVEVKVEFSNVNHTGNLSAKTLEDYLSEEANAINKNFLEAGSKNKSDITKIENKEGLYVAKFDQVTNQSVTLEGCAIIAYYVENPGEYVEINGDTIKTSTANFYVLYKKQNFPLWTVFLAFGLLLALIAVAALKFRKNKE